MTSGVVIYRAGAVWDGTVLHGMAAARFENGIFDGICSADAATGDAKVVELDGDILSPGYVDLQVNGGGGVLLNDDPSPEGLACIARAHRGLGAAVLLPTLITDTPEITAAALRAATEACAQGIPGIGGLHLEGPHLSLARKGAHDAAHIRPMLDEDLQALLAAKSGLPVLKVTVAPESVTLEQVARMARAGILVSLGHTDADYETCRAYAKAGARCVTHLFNAMSQLGSRSPGLVGAALDDGRLSAGVIADGHHVHPASLRRAWRAKAGPGRLFLVSDAMAVAGTDLPGFDLGGRRILREAGRLTLQDGTLAGADLDLTRAMRVMHREAAVPLSRVLAAATRVPAQLCGLPAGALKPGITAVTGVLRIAADLSAAAPLVPMR